MQTVEIQSAQGRIRLQAEGDFQVGERLRVYVSQGGAHQGDSPPGGGGIRIEKAALPAGTPTPGGWVAGEERGAGWQMAGKLDTLRSVRAFEEQLVDWVARRQPGTGAGGDAGAGLARAVLTGNGMAGGGLAAALGGGEAEALMRLPLTELLKRVLAREGGRDFLGQALSGLGRDAFASLLGALEEGPGGAGGPADSGKASLMALLRTLGREIEAARTGAEKPAPGMAGPGGAANAWRGTAQGPGLDLGAFWPGGSARAGAAGGAGSAAMMDPSLAQGQGQDQGTGPASGRGPGMGAGPAGSTLPWMGRVLERSDLGGNLAFAGGKPIPAQAMPRGAAVDPMFRYLLDLGGRTLEVRSGQVREAGEFVEFELENPGGARLQARMLDPLQSQPAGLRAAHGEAAPEGKAALQVAARFLEGFRGEPYHERLVKDFSELLAQSGRLAALPAMGRESPADGQALRAGRMPGPKELENLLRLFIAFPRDAEQPERQARAWSEAARDPKAMLELLRALKPEGDTSLLRAGTALRLAAGGEPPTEAGFPGLPGGKDGEALASVLRKILPEGFKPSELADLARQPAAADAHKAAGPEAKAAQFLLQAFTGLVPREDELREGRPNPFYFYHGQEWKGLQVTWERERNADGRPRRQADGPVKVRVETQARHMGMVDVGVVLQGDKATLDFRNQFHDVGELLAADMPELQKSLALLGVHIEGWSYSRLPDLPNILPTAGWVRPASLDGGNLDLTG